MTILRLLLIPAVLILAACSDPIAKRQANEHFGTAIIATTGDMGTVFPPLVNSTPGRQASELIYEYLAAPGIELNTIGDKGFIPRLADSWSWSADSLSLTFHLNPRARWHDATPVTADDVVYTFALYSDSVLGSSTRQQLSNIASVSTTDSLTALFKFRVRNQLQFFDATSQMQIIPRHIYGGMSADSLRKNSSNIPTVGSGPYRFVQWKQGESTELTADTTNYHGAPKIRRLIWSVSPSPVTASTRLLAGDADIYDVMRPENVKDASTHSRVQIITSDGTDYVFLQFNLRDGKRQHRAHPILASRELRRALTMALDIPAMVKNVFDTLAKPAIGPTIRAFPTTDTSIALLPYDPARASRTMDSLGWKRKTPDGIRERNGRKLRFTILGPVSSLNRHKMAVLLQEQFRKVGVAVDLDEVEFTTFGQRAQSRDFDAYLGNWHLGASAAAVKETWTSTAASTNGGLNYGSYMNAVFDSYVDSATSTMDLNKGRLYYRKAYETAIADAPAIWLYEPRLVLGVHKRIKTGSIRPDAWWSSLPDWEIPPDQQIARDRIR